MRNKILFIIVFILVSCTSSTIYDKPKNLIERDSMVALLTDMYIASSAKNAKNKYLKRGENYMFLVYEKYKVDSTRFNESNIYYTSKTEEYTDILSGVKSNIDSLEKLYEERRLIKDSLDKNGEKRKRMFPLELTEEDANDDELKVSKKR